MPHMPSVAVDTYRTVSRLIEPLWAAGSFWDKVVVLALVFFAGIAYFKWNPRPKSFDLDTSQLSPEGKEAVRKVKELYEESKKIDKVSFKATYGPQNPAIPYIVKLFSNAAAPLLTKPDEEKRKEAEQIAFVVAQLILEDLPKIRAAHKNFEGKRDFHVLKDKECYASPPLKTCCFFLRNSHLYKDLAPRLNDVRYLELLYPAPKTIELDLSNFSQQGQQALVHAQQVYQAMPDLELDLSSSNYQPQHPVIPYLSSLYKAALKSFSTKTKQTTTYLAYVLAQLILADLPKVKAHYENLGAKEEFQILKDPEFYGRNLLLSCSVFLKETPLGRDLAPRFKELKMAEFFNEDDRPIFEAWEYYYSFPWIEKPNLGAFTFGPSLPETIQAIAICEREFRDIAVVDEPFLLRYTKLIFVRAWLALEEISILRARCPELQGLKNSDIVANRSCFIYSCLKEAQKSLRSNWLEQGDQKWHRFKRACNFAKKLDAKLLERCQQLDLALIYGMFSLNEDYK